MTDIFLDSPPFPVRKDDRSPKQNLTKRIFVPFSQSTQGSDRPWVHTTHAPENVLKEWEKINSKKKEKKKKENEGSKYVDDVSGSTTRLCRRGARWNSYSFSPSSRLSLRPWNGLTEPEPLALLSAGWAVQCAHSTSFAFIHNNRIVVPHRDRTKRRRRRHCQNGGETFGEMNMWRQLFRF